MCVVLCADLFKHRCSVKGSLVRPPVYKNLFYSLKFETGSFFLNQAHVCYFLKEDFKIHVIIASIFLIIAIFT